MRVVCLWSGGKDSCFAGYKAKLQGYNILALFNFIKTNGKDSLSHGLSSKIIRRQTKMIGIPVVQKCIPEGNYCEEFKNIITTWKKEKEIEGIVFGDIYLQEHKDWIDKVCQELEVKAVLPLWGRNTRGLILEIINSGFKAIVVSTRAELLGKEWLGRKIDKNFIEELNPEIDPCGEKGEFHTFVYDGPIFKKPVKFILGRKIFENKHYFLEILPK